MNQFRFEGNRFSYWRLFEESELRGGGPLSLRSHTMSSCTRWRLLWCVSCVLGRNDARSLGVHCDGGQKVGHLVVSSLLTCIHAVHFEFSLRVRIGTSCAMGESRCLHPRSSDLLLNCPCCCRRRPPVFWNPVHAWARPSKFISLLCESRALESIVTRTTGYSRGETERWGRSKTIKQYLRMIRAK